jgi:hypothetical protein
MLSKVQRKHLGSQHSGAVFRTALPLHYCAQLAKHPIFLILIKSLRVYIYSTRESSPSRATQAQGCRPSVGPLALPSSGHYTLFFYCCPQPEIQQKVGESSPPTLSNPLPPLPPLPPPRPHL